MDRSLNVNLIAWSGLLMVVVVVMPKESTPFQPISYLRINWNEMVNKKWSRMVQIFGIIVSIYLTRIISTSIFCSANLRAIQDRIPWPNGNTKYGFVDDLVDVPSRDFTQRSGINFSGDSKCLSKRHEMKFCVTVIVWKEVQKYKQFWRRNKMMIIKSHPVWHIVSA